MLFYNKMVIRVFEIDFLEMRIKDDQNSLQPHVGELLMFADTELSK